MAVQGLVWIDVPIDVQSFSLPIEFEHFISQPLPDSVKLSYPFKTIFPGSIRLISLANIYSPTTGQFYMSVMVLGFLGPYIQFLEFLDQWPIPCVTGWNSNDSSVGYSSLLLWQAWNCR